MFFIQKYELLILDRTKLDNFDFEVISAHRHVDSVKNDKWKCAINSKKIAWQIIFLMKKLRKLLVF